MSEAPSLTADQWRLVEILTSTPVEALCPNCGKRYQDPRSANGWCALCDSKRERELESKRAWWHRNRGRGVRREEMPYVDAA